MSDYYYLNEDHTYTPCDLMTWSNQLENGNRQVDYDELDDFQVSTVWIGLDHNFGEGEPLLFETMIFDPVGNGDYLERYTTWAQAEEGHKRAIKWVENGCGKLLLQSPEDKND